MPKEQALILTLRLDEDSQSYFDRQRQAFFPPERNFLKAHLTLFHQLPAADTTHQYLANFKYPSFPVEVTGLMNLGAGVAYKIESPPLQRLNHQLSAHFTETLISQDRQPFRPHITILNKSTPEKARTLLMTLSNDFQPFTSYAIGLDLWTYLDGPWRHERTVEFAPT